MLNDENKGVMKVFCMSFLFSRIHKLLRKNSRFEIYKKKFVFFLKNKPIF